MGEAASQVYDLVVLNSRDTDAHALNILPGFPSPSLNLLYLELAL